MRLLVCLLATLPLPAHDMWIEPATFFPESGEIVGVKLRVGQNMLGDPLPRDTTLIKQFVVDDGSGPKPLVGRDGGNPAGFFRVAMPGLFLIGYASNASFVEQTPEKFSQFLKEEGLETISEMRSQRRETTTPARELFFRCAKSLVLSGTPAAFRGDKVLGFTYEVVAERNPYSARPGDEIPFRLTYETRPRAGALVVAMNRKHPSEKLTARTDKDGRVRFKLPSAGMWMVKSVHMVPAPQGANAEWASYWASLTFELRD